MGTSSRAVESASLFLQDMRLIEWIPWSSFSVTYCDEQQWSVKPPSGSQNEAGRESDIRRPAQPLLPSAIPRPGNMGVLVLDTPHLSRLQFHFLDPGMSI